MKLTKILTEMSRDQRGKNKPLEITRFNKNPFDPKRPQDYWYEYRFLYDVNGGDFSHEAIEAHKKTDYDKFDDIHEYIADDNGINAADQRFVAKGDSPIWVGVKMGEVESHEEEDEAGKYEYVSGTGQAWIVSAVQLPDHVLSKIAKRLEDSLDKRASGQIEGAHESRRDGDEYARDPYAYYGLSRSDF